MSRALGYSHALRRKTVHQKVRQLTDAIYAEFAIIARVSRYTRGAIKVEVIICGDILLQGFAVVFSEATPEDPAIYASHRTTDNFAQLKRIGVDAALSLIEERASILRDLLLLGVGKRVSAIRADITGFKGDRSSE